MKKLSLILMLMLFSFLTIEANFASTNSENQYSRSIYLEKWDRVERSVVPNPIECCLMDNCIKVCFIGHPNTPVTLQIKDTNGNVVYQDKQVNGQQDFYYIEISHLQPGSYEFYYSDEETDLKGEFDII